MTVKGLKEHSWLQSITTELLDSGMKLCLMSPNHGTFSSSEAPNADIAHPARPGGTREALATTAVRPKLQGLALSDACFRTKGHTSVCFTAELRFELELWVHRDTHTRYPRQ